MSKSFFKYASLLFVLLPSAVYGQEVSSPDPVKTDLSDPDLIVRPPTDPYSLSFTPPMPEGAANITTQEHCKQAGGKWTTMKLAEADVQTEKLIGCITNGKRNGRWMVHDIETPPAEQTEEKALGYMWMIDDSVHGWSVMLDRETRTVIELAHFNMGVLDGTQFSWSNVGSLESVTTYKNGKKDGKYERYLECLPTVLGQYTDDNPSGTWDVFPEPGLISIRRNFDRPIPTDDRPSDMFQKSQAYWTEWYNASGVKVSEGYSIAIIPDENGLRVGTLTLYSVSGQKWMTVDYSGVGRISDKRSFELCKPDGQPDAPIPAYLDYNHETLTMNCKNDNGEVYLSVDYYATGEVRAKKPMKNGSINGVVREYHPTGEILAEYNVVDDIPNGTIVYKDTHGNPYGTSRVTNGTGTFKSWWHNGNPHEDGEYKNGKKTGIWTKWLESGTKVNEVQYDDEGRIDGYRRQWFHNGILSFEQKFEHGSNHGLTFYNYSDGRLADECNYHHGMPTGKCKEFAHSGNLSYETDYTNFLNIIQEQYYSDGKKRSSGRITPGFGHGNREGTWDFYLKNGKKWLSLEYSGNAVLQPEAATCAEIVGADFTVDEENREIGCMVCSVNRISPLNPVKMREGRWNWYNDTGKKEKSGSIHLGHLNGDWEYYYPNGEKMLEGEYKIDQRVGKWTGYYEDGSKKFTGAYKNGQESGLWETFYPSSNVTSSSGNFVNGRRDGEWTYQYQSGKLREKGSFENGVESGVWTNYYENGQKQGEGSFVAGKREGTWTWYRENGSVWRTAEYKDGKEIKK